MLLQQLKDGGWEEMEDMLKASSYKKLNNSGSTRKRELILRFSKRSDKWKNQQ